MVLINYTHVSLLFNSIIPTLEQKYLFLDLKNSSRVQKLHPSILASDKPYILENVTKIWYCWIIYDFSQINIFRLFHDLKPPLHFLPNLTTKYIIFTSFLSYYYCIWVLINYTYVLLRFKFFAPTLEKNIYFWIKKKSSRVQKSHPPILAPDKR